MRIKKFEFAKQRKNHGSDPKIQKNKKESNKKSYQTAKDKKSAMKEKRRIEYQKEDAKKHSKARKRWPKKHFSVGN